MGTAGQAGGVFQRLSQSPERTVDFLLDCTRERSGWLYRRPCLPFTGNGECKNMNDQKSIIIRALNLNTYEGSRYANSAVAQS